MVKWHYISSLMFNQHCHCHTHTRLSQTVQFRCLHPKCLKERERRGVEEGGREAGREGRLYSDHFPRNFSMWYRMGAENHQLKCQWWNQQSGQWRDFHRTRALCCTFIFVWLLCELHKLIPFIFNSHDTSKPARTPLHAAVFFRIY